MLFEEMKKSLSFTKLPLSFSEYYPKVKDNYIERTEQMLSETLIQQTLTECGILIKYREEILTAAKALRNRKEFRLFLALLSEYITHGGDTRSGEYEPPVGEGVMYDFLHLFPTIPTMKASVEFLKNRNVPQDIIYDTMKEYDSCVQNCEQYLGRPAFDHKRLGWIRLLINNSLIRIGRLKYELPKNRESVVFIRVYQNKNGKSAVFADGVSVHRDGMILGSPGYEDTEQSFFADVLETDETVTGHLITDGLIEANNTTLKKEDWTLAFSKNDPVVNIHIPSDGSFDKACVEGSYQRTRDILKNCYPDFPYKAFVCSSWLMSRSLRNLLKPSSNILAFQDKFTLFPYPAYGTGVFNFVFPEQGIPDDYNTLPENTSLQRAVKQTYLDGKFIHEFSGFFF